MTPSFHISFRAPEDHRRLHAHAECEFAAMRIQTMQRADISEPSQQRYARELQAKTDARGIDGQAWAATLASPSCEDSEDPPITRRIRIWRLTDPLPPC